MRLNSVSTMKVASSPYAPSRRMRFIVTIVCALLACALTSAEAADDAAAAARATLSRIQAVRKERPNDGVLVFYQALIHVSLGERDAAFELLRSLNGRKLGLIPVRDAGFDALWNDPEFQTIRKELADEEPQTPASPVAFRLKDPKLIPEGIAFDAKGARFFIGSIAQRKIIVRDAKSQVRDFSSPSDKLDAALGLAMDAERGHLYAVSTNGFLAEANTERRNAVVRYDLKSGRLTNRFFAPEAMQLNDLAVAPDGTLYVTDSMNSTLFRRKPDEAKLTRFGAAGALRGANGIAVGADGILYAAISTGIVRVDTATGEPTRLPQPDTVVTGGIDGLYWHDGDLIGVQNVTNPGRVVRIALTNKGTRVAGLTVLQSHHHPDFDEPTTGTIANSALHVIGNSYAGRYQPDGTIKDAADLKETAVIAVPLRH
jgi:sugar lactone lactonase YvrE